MHGFMHGFLNRFFKSSLTFLITILICGVLASLAAFQARSEYRNYIGFSKQTQDLSLLESEQENSSDFFDLGIDNKYLDSALNFAGDAKDWTTDQLKNNPLTESFAKLLKLVETLIFWITFLITFISTVFVLGKLKALKDALVEKTDPAVEENIQRLATAVNQLHDQLNSQQANSAPSFSNSSPLTNTNPSQNG